MCWQLALLWLLVFFPAGIRAAPPPLTLDQAIAIALRDSPLVIAGRHQVAAAGFGRQAAKGNLYPRLDSYASYRRQSDPSVVVPIKEFGGPSPMFSRDHYSLGVTLKIPVYEGGRLRREVSAAELSRAVSRAGLNLTGQELVANVTTVFKRIPYLEKQLESSSFTLNALKKAGDDTRIRLESGRVAPVDLMRINTQIAAQEQALAALEEECRRTRQLLAQLLGREPEPPLAITGELALPPEIPLPSPQLPDISQRPDIRKAQNQVRLAENKVKLLQGYHLPSIDLIGDYGRRAGSGLEADEEVWSGGVAVSFNLFSGGSISARVDQAGAELLAAREELRRIRLAALTQVSNALSRLRETRARYRVAEQKTKTARETFRIEELKYKKGAGSITDSLLAQSSWFQADARRIMAVYNYHTALIDYELALGAIDIASLSGAESRPEEKREADAEKQ